jgi:hypothetical protein
MVNFIINLAYFFSKKVLIGYQLLRDSECNRCCNFFEFKRKYLSDSIYDMGKALPLTF